MDLPIPRPDLQFVLDQANAAARRLIRQLRLPHSELEDFRQELLVDLIARLPAYDPARGSLEVFLAIVLANKATRIARVVKAHRRLFGAHPVSLDDPMPGLAGMTRGDLVAERDGHAALCGQPIDAFAAVERRIDLERHLGIVSRKDAALCAALSHATVKELAAHGRGARASLYRRVRDIRLAFTAVGLGAA